MAMSPREPLKDQVETLAALKATAQALLVGGLDSPTAAESVCRILWLAGRAERQQQDALRRLAGYWPIEVRGQRVDGSTYCTTW